MWAVFFERLKSLTSNATFVFLSILAVALQIQVTLFQTPTYMGLRINLADLFLPLMLGFAILSILLRKSSKPHWQLTHVYLWLAGLFAILTIALINGYLANGYWSSWALVNKYIGFLILCAYFFLGGWVVTNSEKPSLAQQKFSNWFCGFFIVTLAFSAVLIFLQNFTQYDLWLSDFAWDGFMANRNAFMVLAVFVMISLMVFRSELRFSPKFWMHNLFWTFLPLLCLYNASRTGWIAFSIILILYFFRKPWPKLRVILPFMMLGVLLATASFYTPVVPMNEKKRQFFRLFSGYELTSTPDEEIVYVEGDQHRLIAVEDGFELYSRSNPVIGSGLGTYKEFQIQKRGEFINLIDFTALWLLVETGALGLAAFTAFFLVCIHSLYQSGWKEAQPFQKTMFLYLIVFVGMSVMHELMYSRFLWFMMGLALAQTVKKEED